MKIEGIVLATSNKNKVKEIEAVLGSEYGFKSLEDIGCQEELPETSDTLEGNALQKARYVYDNYKVNCFAEDTGLEVEALHGEPGVLTARYAGPGKDTSANMELLLQKLQNEENRKARFRTIMALIIDGQEYLFEGICNGTIAERKRGEQGFGYDPVFVPDGFNLSFAEMDLADKKKISHRSIALMKLKSFLEK